MKTPIQELMIKILSLKKLDAIINPIDVIYNIAKMQLEKEEQVIIDAYDDCGECFKADGSVFHGKDYYNETFKL